ncbi:hypothetical protein [Pelagicoccus mobilis]|uniref:Uncharacterized protein n=1 Tax=Pelagicoccus mobilis TaxID=415221 RepID=A0A934S4I3_9BACT|nr:hypothetical protein [Pelagicoccus mobilis]MBK1878868.1 hypothetical protein [Pelagicoccus mobilis]
MSVVSPPRSRQSPASKPKKRRKGAMGYTREQWVIGVGGTICIHIWLILFLMFGKFTVEPMETVDRFKDFSIELEAPLEPEEEEQVYTQTNPDVPDNEPDDTNRFSARNQQAANEEKPEELDPENRPANESDDNIETEQVLSGTLYEPLPALPPSESPNEESQEPEEQSTPPQPPSPNQPLLAAVEDGGQTLKKEIPLFGSQEEAEDESGLAEHVYDKLEEAPTNITDYIEGEQDEGETEQTVEESPELVGAPRARPTLEAIQARDGVPTPRARPQLPRLPSGPTRDSRLGVSSVGRLAVDAKASKFGEYMERLIETVKLNWDDLVERSSAEERKSVVKIKFILNQHGIVEDIEILEGTTARAIGIYMCREAIQRGVPFGAWPEGLVDMFGTEEDITFSFHYY